MKKLDLTGQRFGRLVVIEEAGRSSDGRVRWLCKCDCGNYTSTPSTKTLRNGTCRSCGCIQEENRLTCRKIEMKGRRFGQLTVIEEGTKTGKETMWVCVCDCGNKVTVNGNSLRQGKTVSCGCHRKTLLVTHGLYQTRLHRIWRGMKQRCSNPNKQHYDRYGGRGIKVCDEWENDFQAFYNWAMSNGYRDDLTIDRIDNDGDYEPSNCQWITQAENTSKAIKNRKK